MNSLSTGKPKIKISFNSPVVLWFAILCLISLILSYVTQGYTNQLLFSVYRSSLLDPFTYVRFFGHVLGHADMEHYLSNMMFLLVVGPLLEEKYGSKSLLFVILSTAFVTGVLNFVLFPNIQLLGASGVVFAFILLSSFTSLKQGEIPLTFILVAFLYIGEQILDGIMVEDNISNFAHILGGVCGSVLGYLLNRNKLSVQCATQPFYDVNQSRPMYDPAQNSNNNYNTYY